MTRRHPVCAELEPHLIASAIGEADAATARRVQAHVGVCAPCDAEYRRYRTIDHAVEAWRTEPAPATGLERARQRLERQLGDLRPRMIRYRVFRTPLGNLLIARSEHGLALVEYLDRKQNIAHSRLRHVRGIETIEDGAEVETVCREILEYLAGQRTRLDVPIDPRLARSGFHRAVLDATAGIPYGAVTSYANIAREVGKPDAARAVAQALRWNPVPIVVPCHRVVGADGALTGYAGNRIGLKQRLLGVEGVRTVRSGGQYAVLRPAMYVRHREDESYCLPTCGSLPARTLAELTLFASRERAEAVGLQPCAACRPDLHAIPA